MKSAVGRVGELHHLLARNPPAVAERERHVVLGEQREHAVVNPAALPELDRESDVARQLRKKLRDGRKLRRREVGTELNENRAELVAELARAVEELRGEIVDVAQAPLVGDLLRHLEREDEIVRRSLRPAANGLRHRARVEGRIDLDRVERARVDGEKVRRARVPPDRTGRPRHRSSSPAFRCRILAAILWNRRERRGARQVLRLRTRSRSCALDW